MTDAIMPATQQGVVSTQIEQTQKTAQPVQQQPLAPEPEAPAAPPADSGRGANVDVTA